MMFSRGTTRLASTMMLRTSKSFVTRTCTKMNSTGTAMSRRWMSDTTTAAKQAIKETPKAETAEPAKKTGLWNSPQFWGNVGALAGWGISGAAIYDSLNTGPEVISLKMTPVLIVYSTLFARWAWVVQPRNLLLCACHVTNVGAQLNQFRRALEYKIANGEEKQVTDMLQKMGVAAAATGVAIVAAPKMRSTISNANLGIVSTIAAAPAGPFTVHFWAPMSKWFISGASFLELDRPTDKISLSQYTALTITGLFFTRYALLVIPINYTLCSVNVALFFSSAWHLGRKIKADYIDDKKPDSEEKKIE